MRRDLRVLPVVHSSEARHVSNRCNRYVSVVRTLARHGYSQLLRHKSTDVSGGSAKKKDSSESSATTKAKIVIGANDKLRCDSQHDGASHPQSV